MILFLPAIYALLLMETAISALSDFVKPTAEGSANISGTGTIVTNT